MLLAATLVLFPLMMAFAAASDLLTMTISNRVSIALVIGFVALALAAGMPIETLLEAHLACGAAVLVLTFALFAFGWIGGGDAKLAAATAVWLGWEHLFDYGLLSSMMGGALTLAILAFRKREIPAPLAGRAWVGRLHAANNGVPYGIALALAGLFLYTDTAVWSAVAAG